MRHYIPTRTYETTFVLRPNLSDSEVEERVERFRDYIASNGNEILKVELWGRRRLAYPIRRFQEGVYTFIVFHGKPEFVRELEQQYRLNEDVLRYLTVRVEGEFDPNATLIDAPVAESGSRSGSRRPSRSRPEPAGTEEPFSQTEAAAEEE